MPTNTSPEAIEARFWARVNKTDACWLWTGKCSGSNANYGSFKVGGKSTYVHRYAYEIMVGPIPAGLTIDHLCRVTKCVNPSHLEPVTIQENLRRADIKQPCPTCGEVMLPRHLKHHLPICLGEITPCGAGHTLDAANTYWWNGVRRCRRCHADRAREYRARRAA